MHNSQRRSIARLHPTPRQVPVLRVSRSGFIQADMRHPRGYLLAYQELTAVDAACYFARAGYEVASCGLH